MPASAWSARTLRHCNRSSEKSRSAALVWLSPSVRGMRDKARKGATDMTATTNEPKASLKERALSETRKYVGYTIYLAMVFAAFSNYRRLVLSEYEIAYLNYGYSLIEAMILAKVILIGEALKLGERRADEPLIIPTLYKAFMFGLLVV